MKNTISKINAENLTYETIQELAKLAIQLKKSCGYMEIPPFFLL